MRGDSPLFSETSASPENKKSWGRYQLPPTPQSVLSPPGPWRVSVLESSGPPPPELLVLAQPVVAPDVVFPEQPPVLPGLGVQLLQLLGGAHIHLEQPLGVLGIQLQDHILALLVDVDTHGVRCEPDWVCTHLGVLQGLSHRSTFATFAPLKNCGGGELCQPSYTLGRPAFPFCSSCTLCTVLKMILTGTRALH